MTEKDTFILLIVAVLFFVFFIFLIVPIIKILAMIDVFGWNKTRELLHDKEWYRGGEKTVSGQEDN